MEGCDYHTVLARDIDTTPRYLATGTPTCMSANRLSYFFNLSGASIAIDSACSSSMSAMHQAVSALQRKEAGMVLVCGAKLIINPDMFISNSELNFLGPSGRCNTFDMSADGYGRGEGALAYLLKPLEKARADNDSIQAIIRGTNLNQDGRTQGITLPSAEAQASNMKKLYSNLGISPKDIQYVEAHVGRNRVSLLKGLTKSIIGNWHRSRRSARDKCYQLSLLWKRRIHNRRFHQI